MENVAFEKYKYKIERVSILVQEILFSFFSILKLKVRQIVKDISIYKEVYSYLFIERESSSQNSWDSCFSKCSRILTFVSRDTFED